MLEFIISGGFMMYPLLFCSILVLAVVIDRLLAFQANAAVDTRALRAEVLALLEEDEVDDALALCASVEGPVASTLHTGLVSYAKLRAKGEKPEVIRDVVTQVMDDYSLHAMSAVEARFAILTTIGTAAPLLGMTGTVTGMIASFAAMKDAAGLGGGAVAGGISEALVTTAAGLIIALFAVIPHSIFSSMAAKIELELEEITTELHDFILTHH